MLVWLVLFWRADEWKKPKWQGYQNKVMKNTNALITEIKWRGYYGEDESSS